MSPLRPDARVFVSKLAESYVPSPPVITSNIQPNPQPENVVNRLREEVGMDTIHQPYVPTLMAPQTPRPIAFAASQQDPDEIARYNSKVTTLSTNPYRKWFAVNNPDSPEAKTPRNTDLKEVQHILNGLTAFADCINEDQIRSQFKQMILTLKEIYKSIERNNDERARLKQQNVDLKKRIGELKISNKELAENPKQHEGEVEQLHRSWEVSKEQLESTLEQKHKADIKCLEGALDDIIQCSDCLLMQGSPKSCVPEDGNAPQDLANSKFQLNKTIKSWHVGPDSPAGTTPPSSSTRGKTRQELVEYVSELEKKNEKDSTKIHELRNLQNTVDLLKEEAVSKTKDIKELESTVESLQLEDKAKAKTIEDLKSTVQNLQEQDKANSALIKDLESTVAKLESELGDHDEIILRFESKIKHLRKKKEAATTALDAIAKIDQNVAERISDLENKCKQRNEVICQLRSDCAAKDDTVNKRDARIRDLGQSCEEKVEKITKLQDDLLKSEKALNVALQNQRRADRAYSTKVNELQRAEATKAQLKKKIEASRKAEKERQKQAEIAALKSKEEKEAAIVAEVIIDQATVAISAAVDEISATDILWPFGAGFCLCFCLFLLWNLFRV